MAGRTAREGFTLVEIMIVVGLMTMIMAIGIPTMLRSLHKDPMRQAVSDLMEACTRARGHAILYGVPTELHFNLHDRAFGLGLASTPAPQDSSTTTLAPARAPVSSPSFSAHFSDRLVIEMLDVNFVEKRDADEARVRFYPNGTCDEFTVVLNWPEKNQYRKVSLDVITSLADMEVIR